MRQTKLDLSAQLGGDPSPAEALLIQGAALKACRLYLLSEKLLDGGDISEGTDHHALAWLNSMRLDLQALGLKRVVRDVTPSLKDILAEHGTAEKATEPISDRPRRGRPPGSRKPTDDAPELFVEAVL